MEDELNARLMALDSALAELVVTAQRQLGQCEAALVALRTLLTDPAMPAHTQPRIEAALKEWHTLLQDVTPAPGQAHRDGFASAAGYLLQPPQPTAGRQAH